MIVFSEPRFQRHFSTRASYKRAFFREDGQYCEMCGRPLHGQGQTDHILPVGQFPELEYDPRNLFCSCGCGGKLDFHTDRIGRPTVAQRIEMILASFLRPRAPWVLEAARKRLHPEDYERLKKTA